MKINDEGIYVVKGKLDAVTGGTVTVGVVTKLDYVEVDGERWGNIVILGSMCDNLESSMGKEVELHFLSDKNRILIGFRVEGEKRFHTAEKSLIKSCGMSNIITTRVGAPLLATITVIIAVVGGGGGFMGILIGISILVGTIWLADIATSGKTWRKANRYIEKYNSVK